MADYDEKNLTGDGMGGTSRDYMGGDDSAVGKSQDKENERMGEDAMYGADDEGSGNGDEGAIVGFDDEGASDSDSE